MKSSRDPLDNADADAPRDRDDAPPTQQPPQYSRQHARQAHDNEPETTSRPSTGSQSSRPPVQVLTKPEASSYTGSYRPQNAQPYTPAESSTHHGFDAGGSDEPVPDLPPPAYTELPGQISSENSALGTQAIVADDGRVNIRIDQKSRSLSQLIVPQIQRQLTQVEKEPPPPPPYIPESLGGAPGQDPPPPLNVVIQIVGSRGDVQPFVALGKVLKKTYGHRVRLATHPVFKDFVNENGLEFFSLGGDPAELMTFMQKNPGLMPGFETMRSGDIGKRRKGIAEILRGTWRSCIETGDGLGVDPINQTIEEWTAAEDQLPDQLKKPFVADAIIANPPAFGHIHCAERLGIPVHMMFTMPWSPTQSFPQPLANIQASNADQSITNYVSYLMVDLLTWQGLGDIINSFRKESLHLDSVSIVWASSMLERLKIPFTYCWSPALIPKPKDWGHHISIAGFFFLDLALNYTPEPDLAAFLAAGEPPVYIGFGSIVVEDPNAMTALIFEAVKKTGRRALVSKGWGGLGADDLRVPEGVFMLGNCPHDWLFKHVSAVVHHGGAGTTAAGIAAGRPTVVVPFFGDQPFWGAMVARAGAGPDPIPNKELTADNLAAAITQALLPQSLERAQELCNKMKRETGSQVGAQAFHQMLKYDDLRCAVTPSRPAVWRIKRTQIKLSARAATVLAQEGELDFDDLKLYRPREYDIDLGPVEPISGGTTAIMGTMTSMMMGVADMPVQTLKLLNIHPDSAASKKGKGRAKSDDTMNSFAESGASTPTGVSSPGVYGSDHKELGGTGTPGTASHKFSPTDQPRTNSGSSSGFSANIKNAYETGTSGTVIDTGKGVARIVGAGFKAPMDFTLNVAQGLNNIPKLYGASTRPVDKVTDFKSGMRAGVKGFGLGIFDSMAGIFTDPYKGAKKEGGIGFIKGFGQGVFSVPWRFIGGIWSLPGYAMKGLYQEMNKGKGQAITNYIIAARVAQGLDEAANISAGESAYILSTWKEVKAGMKIKKTPGREQLESLHTFVSETRKPKHEQSDRRNPTATNPEVRPTFLQAGSDYSSSQSSTVIPAWRQAELGLRPQVSNKQSSSALQYTATFPSAGSTQAGNSQVTSENQLTAEEENERLEFEAAIAASVAESSRQYPDEKEDLKRAMHASMQQPLDVPPGYQDAVGSQWNYENSGAYGDQQSGVLGGSGQHSVSHTNDDEDAELKKAIEESEREEKDRVANLRNQMTEEEIVMEYVRKQSLMEEEHRQRALQNRGEAGESSRDRW